MPQAIRGTVLLIASIGILSAAMLHATVNVPHLHGDLLEIGARRTLVAAVALVLYFSVVAMFAFGGLVLNSAVESFRGKYPEQAPLWVVAVSYVVFGLVAFVLVSRSPHVLGYAVMGLLVAVGAALPPPPVGNGIRGAS